MNQNQGNVRVAIATRTGCARGYSHAHKDFPRSCLTQKGYIPEKIVLLFFGTPFIAQLTQAQLACLFPLNHATQPPTMESLFYSCSQLDKHSGVSLHKLGN